MLSLPFFFLSLPLTFTGAYRRSLPRHAEKGRKVPLRGKRKTKGRFAFLSVDWFQCFLHRIDDSPLLFLFRHFALSRASAHALLFPLPHSQVLGVAKDAPQVSPNRENACAAWTASSLFDTTFSLTENGRSHSLLLSTSTLSTSSRSPSPSNPFPPARDPQGLPPPRGPAPPGQKPGGRGERERSLSVFRFAVFFLLWKIVEERGRNRERERERAERPPLSLPLSRSLSPSLPPINSKTPTPGGKV